MFPVPTWWWGAVTGVVAEDLCTTRYRWVQNRPGAMTKSLGIAISVTLRHRGRGPSHLFKRASQAWRTRPLMISFFASMIPTRERFLAYEIADMPTVLVCRALLSLFLSLPLYSRQRCEGTANPVALVFTAAAQRSARPITKNFCVYPTLVAKAFYVLPCGTASTGTDYPDPTRRTRPSMTRRGAGVRTAAKLL